MEPKSITNQSNIYPNVDAEKWTSQNLPKATPGAPKGRKNSDEGSAREWFRRQGEGKRDPVTNKETCDHTRRWAVGPANLCHTLQFHNSGPHLFAAFAWTLE